MAIELREREISYRADNVLWQGRDMETREREQSNITMKYITTM